MHGYRVRGRTAATAATAGHAIAALWNPHATKRIRVVEFGLFKTGAGAAADALELRRSTTRGTPGSTVTPAIQQDDDRDLAPPSGALLDLAAFTVQPTLEAGGLFGWVAANVAGSGLLYPTGAIVLPPGAGLVIVQIAATAWPASDVSFRWEE